MDKKYFKEYYVQERKHWWFLARLKILDAQIKQVLKGKSDIKILNIGIATGATTEMLSKHGRVTSLEYDQDCCDFVKERLNIDVIHGSILDLPFQSGSFDLVCAFDVIEHVEDDHLGVAEMKRVCKDGGSVFVTVPAFMDLWSDHDVINHHFRRYVRKELIALFKPSQNIRKVTYFNTILFFPIYAARKFSKIFNKNSAPQSDFNKFKPGMLNSLLHTIFHLESWFLKRKISLPIGVSIMIVWDKLYEGEN